MHFSPKCQMHLQHSPVSKLRYRSSHFFVLKVLVVLFGDEGVEILLVRAVLVQLLVEHAVPDQVLVRVLLGSLFDVDHICLYLRLWLFSVVMICSMTRRFGGRGISTGLTFRVTSNMISQVKASLTKGAPIKTNSD